MSATRIPGPTCPTRRPFRLADGTVTLSESPLPGPFKREAENDPDTRRETQALAWLQQHRSLIVQAEQRFCIDRRAVAAVIAWESLMNIRNALPHLWNPGGMMMTVGVHGTPGRAIPSFDAELLKQIEDADWLPGNEQVPKQTDENRATQLATLEGAVVYIAAAMNAASHLANRAGFPSIRKNPIPLVLFWQQNDLVTWRRYLDEKPQTSAFEAGADPVQDIDAWVQQNHSFLTDAVGSPAFYEAPGDGWRR